MLVLVGVNLVLMLWLAHESMTVLPAPPGVRGLWFKDIDAKVAARDATLRKLGADLTAIRKALAGESASDGSKSSDGDVGKGGGPEPWLVVGIPTVPRIDSATGKPLDYLSKTVDALVTQMSSHPASLEYRQVVVVVMNHAPKAEHVMLDAAKERVASARLSHAFVFVDNDGSVPNPTPGATDVGSPNKPGYKVRQQTRDVVALLREAAPRGRYFMFLEDDFELCPNGFAAIAYMVRKMEAYSPGFVSVRASFGLAGIVMPSPDALVFADYLEKHQARRPPDHLCSEWTGKETPEAVAYLGQRVNGAFRYNILHHLGRVSTLRSELSVPYPGCYEFLGEPILFKVEAFDPRACPRDDVWPCPPTGPTAPLVDFRGEIPPATPPS
ncbi:uncharacterized protein AMSG_01917 [Thecamonas trahens ATCC 50062]|uniref:Uncharacterized protein n=1 Tax=Thecamonas trahens ATCC 50062 TaxID=461836 RepID=A0A0L0DVV5_THETB|nr:hypothetical protein AMSG_01917 [Thecamonas trahens ATCC 50062]KNC55648.1 hypothetical protein AMSG_01917 [Thecamonas trahens ATCC 50062]|eukprot:XP_013761418.1 hypothetical protein AMSG_01917 [Thecamonas trahens ATCC 50062]